MPNNTSTQSSNFFFNQQQQPRHSFKLPERPGNHKQLSEMLQQHLRGIGRGTTTTTQVDTRSTGGEMSNGSPPAVIQRIMRNQLTS